MRPIFAHIKLLEKTLDLSNRGFSSQSSDYVVQMHQIKDLKLDMHNGEVCGPFCHLDIVDVAAGFTNNLGDFG
jgi:hypothetical protein